MPVQQPRSHRWTLVALGRICSICQLVQANGEFDDSVPCSGRPG